VGIFWHHPWPSAEQFSICPWRKELLDGILGADVVGFHTQQYCNNFMETVGKEVESLIDLERFVVTRGGHESLVRALPISIAFTNGSGGEKDTGPAREALRKLNITSEFVGLGVDRLDYIKGVIERLRAVETFLDVHPEYRTRFTFVQISSPSRESSQKHREYGQAVTAEAERINQKFQTESWKPIVFEKRHYSHDELEPLYRAVNFCLVSSLHDGMNLVSKEFAAARDDESGALILSKFTGSSRDLKGAIVVNPYSIEELGEAIYQALTMSPVEQHRRMKLMRNSIKNYNVYRWAAEFIKAVAGLS
jgi:trehalose 6-phosphate synthase